MTTTIDVSVTPTAGHGPNVDCDVTGAPPYVVDNAIFLPDDGAPYDIRFTLVPGAGITAWNANAFCADRGKCPRRPAPPPNTPQAGFSAEPPNGLELIVHAAAAANRGVVHYKLEFNGGNSCDPIIVRI